MLTRSWEDVTQFTAWHKLRYGAQEQKPKLPPKIYRERADVIDADQTLRNFSLRDYQEICLERSVLKIARRSLDFLALKRWFVYPNTYARGSRRTSQRPRNRFMAGLGD